MSVTAYGELSTSKVCIFVLSHSKALIKLFLRDPGALVRSLMRPIRNVTDLIL